MKIILSGYSGAMGRVVTELCQELEGYEIVAGYSRREVEGFKYPVYSDLNDINEDADVIIDFSNVDAVLDVVDYAVKENIPMVIASTGLGDNQYEAIEKAAKDIPIIQSGNMSLGINKLIDIVEGLASALSDFDVEIIEKHHNKKVDSPSGTANMLVDAVKSGRENVSRVIYGREGNDTKRQDGELGVHAIRGGTIVGEHSVIFAGVDEVVEIKHIASSKRIFANGAIKAANFIVQKENGLYSMKDVI